MNELCSFIWGYISRTNQNGGSFLRMRMQQSILTTGRRAQSSEAFTEQHSCHVTSGGKQSHAFPQENNQNELN